MRTAVVFTLLAGLATLSAYGAVTKEDIEYGGWPNCIRLSNGAIELVATTDVGPRIIRFGFVNGQNLFKEYPDMLGKTGGDEWRIFGGHRLWHSPEQKPRTYAPDNVPVEAQWDGKALRLTPPLEAVNGIQKEMVILMDPDNPVVEIRHKLSNMGAWDIELAPWALTVMAQGGRAIYPHEPFVAHTDYLLPARPLVLWHYTDMADPRWTWGTKYIQLRQDPKAETPQKVGFLNKQGWAAYYLEGELFLKKYPVDPAATYPDHGCNTETFTNADMLEVESLGPLATLSANGGAVEHTETWSLHKAEFGDKESSFESALQALVK